MAHRSALLGLAALGLAGASLGGCDDFYRAIGREKVVPDEFAVVSRAPLAIPPDYSLRPPRVGTQRPQEVAPVDQARQTVFRAGEQQAGLPPATVERSAGEGELLREAGAGTAPNNIRQLIDTEAVSADDMSDSFVDKLEFWRSKEPKLGPTDQVIDPNAEAERLKASSGKAADANSGLNGAPTIERTKTGSGSGSSSWFGWLGKIF